MDATAIILAAGVAFALLACGVGGAAELAFERGGGGARGYHARGIG